MQKREEDNGHTVHKDCQKTDWQYQKPYTAKQEKGDDLINSHPQNILVSDVSVLHHAAHTRLCHRHCRLLLGLVNNETLCGKEHASY